MSSCFLQKAFDEIFLAHKFKKGTNDLEFISQDGKSLKLSYIATERQTQIDVQWDEQGLRNCPACGGVRYLEKKQGHYRCLSPCQGQYTLQRIDAFNRAQIPTRFARASFDNFNLQKLTHYKEKVKTYQKKLIELQPGSVGSLLYGGPGTGKTHLLCAGIRYLTLERGIACRYADFSILLSEIRAAYTLNVSEYSLIEPLATVPVLFLDELGKGREKANDFELRIIDEIIGRRYDNNRLVTFFASNYKDRNSSGYNALLHKSFDPNQKLSDAALRKLNYLKTIDHLEDRISNRSFSRISQMTNTVSLGDDDYRQRVTREP